MLKLVMRFFVLFLFFTKSSESAVATFQVLSSYKGLVITVLDATGLHIAKYRRETV